MPSEIKIKMLEKKMLLSLSQPNVIRSNAYDYSRCLRRDFFTESLRCLTRDIRVDINSLRKSLSFVLCFFVPSTKATF